MPKGIPIDRDKKIETIKNKRYAKYKPAIDLLIEDYYSTKDIISICRTNYNLTVSQPTLSRLKKEFIDNYDR